MPRDRFIEAFARELVSVVGVQASFGILMKAYEALDEKERKKGYETFLLVMSALKSLDKRQK